MIAQVNYITEEIKPHLIDKKWSSHPNTTDKILFEFDSNGTFRLSTAGNQVGLESYYLTSDNCYNDRSNFDESKKGQNSDGNYIKTQGFCYEIEFYPTYDKFRIKQTNESNSKWRDFFLVN